jgi:alpha-glucosidase
VDHFKWWQKAVFYQIYPRSFADGNGDGIGDFKGMIKKLDYLTDLGVDALWLSPYFPSPMYDCGYDISDYKNVAPEYGTLDEFKTFLDGAHARGLHLILDMVLNHTSDEHRWFLESKSSRDNPKADWYVWKDPAPLPPPSLRDTSPISGVRNGGGREGVPNNWQSCFDGPAWTYAPERGQYYYHYFMRQQPDLNWHNPDVHKAMWGAARFWLDMGVDGFRLDAIGTIYEDPKLTPHTVPMDLAGLRHFSDIAKTPAERALVEQYWRDMFKNQLGQPGIHELMKELRSVLDEYAGDRMLVGEDDDVTYQGNGEDELSMVFDFPLMRTDLITPEWVRKNQRERIAALAKVSPDAWACNTLGNHDCSRIYSRYSASRTGGNGTNAVELARLNLAVVLTMRGTPFLYNGEEIGMTDYLIPDPTKLRDTMATWYYDRLVNELRVERSQAALRAAAMSRDKNRTPLQWRNAPNGGFCPAEVTPWLPVNPNYAEGINVQDQEKDPASLLTFYRRLLRVRKATPALVEGDYRSVHETAQEVLAFLRSTSEQKVLVLLNFSEKQLSLDFSDLGVKSTRVIFSTAGQAPTGFPQLMLDPFEIWISDLK